MITPSIEKIDPLKLLSKSEAAKRMGIGRKTLTGLIDNGCISTRTIGKRQYVIAKSILDYYDMQRPQYDNDTSLPPYFGEVTNPDIIEPDRDDIYAPTMSDIFSYDDFFVQSPDEIFKQLKGKYSNG